MAEIENERISKIDEEIKRLKNQKKELLNIQKRKERALDNHKKIILGGNLLAYFRESMPTYYEKYINITVDKKEDEIKTELNAIFNDFLKSRS